MTKYTLPADFDLEANHASFRLGMPYYCWYCAQLNTPGDKEHLCRNEIPGGEEVLANPYTTLLTEDIFKIASRNQDFDLPKALRHYGDDGVDPLFAVVLSILFDCLVEKRPEWLEKVDNLDPKIKAEMIAFRS